MQIIRYQSPLIINHTGKSMTHTISQEGIDLIKKFESYSPTPYLCPAQKWTIGYGHVIKAGETFKHLTEEEATILLAKDLKTAEYNVRRQIFPPIKQNQFDSLVSFTFNVGAAALQRSTLRQKINRLDFESITDEFMRWVYAGGIKLRGLMIRRHAEASLFTG